MLAEQLRKFSVEVWDYCPMPNHVHLILTPQEVDGTAEFVTELERRIGRPIARRAPGRKAVAISVGEQLNLLQ